MYLTIAACGLAVVIVISAVDFIKALKKPQGQAKKLSAKAIDKSAVGLLPEKDKLCDCSNF